MRLLPLLFAAPLLAALTPCLGEEAVPASTEELAWFAGRWATAPADLEGFTTLTPEPIDCAKAVTITIRDGALYRAVTLRDGRQVESGFEVMRFAGNYPWWPLDGGGTAVAKRLDAQSFVLAATSMGKAQWAQGRKHIRCAE